MNWLREGLAWRWRLFRRLWSLLFSFRNGAALARGYLRKRACGRAVCWDGTVISHPQTRRGLPETILKTWVDHDYTADFYQPESGDVVIDAGANIGLFSVWLARRHPGCRILAYEPFAENYRFLRQNIAAARLNSVEPYHAALGAVSAVGKMNDGGGRSVDHRLAVECDSTDVASVRVCALADVLEMAQSDRVALFKLNIEGSEYDLFEKANPADLERISRFAIEYHDNIRPGTLAFLQSRLSGTHELEIRPSGEPGYGMVYARLRKSA